MYLLNKEELQNDTTYVATEIKEKTLYHATSAIKALSIAQNNFDWRKNVRSRFGVGVCFSPNPKYSDKYASSHGGMFCKKTKGEIYCFKIIIILHRKKIVECSRLANHNTRKYYVLIYI